MYITLAQLAEQPGVKELAEVATPAHLRLVDYDLMHATLTGADRSAWTPDETAVADLAIARINSAITEAVAEIDGFLSPRGYLPLQSVPDIVSSWCRAITRYKLHQNRLNADDKDPITRAYTDAMKLLKLTAEGKFSLGVEDKVITQGAGMPEFVSGQSIFRDAMKDF